MESKVRHTARWILSSQNGIDSLTFEEIAPVPELGPEDVLVKMHAASINYRDLVITKVNTIKSNYQTQPLYLTF
jgi:NADPH:quinone reductase-like Zn-dependent oxidoreductase